MLIFFYLLNIILIPRLFFYIKDEPLTLTRLLIKLLITLILFSLIKIQLSSIILLLLIFGVFTVFYYVEKKSVKINVVRFLELISLIILVNIFTSGLFGSEFSEPVLDFMNGISHAFLFTENASDFNWDAILKISAGILLVLNEVNLVIRIIFQEFDLLPKSEDAELHIKLDAREYNAGRIIGMLERLLLFILILLNQFGAIGLIIAAKAFARFKALDIREFAEYVLIGTLLSVVLSFAVTLWIKYQLIL